MSQHFALFSIGKPTGNSTGLAIDFVDPELPLVGGMLNGPSWVPDEAFKLVRGYRDAVLLCWVYRRNKAMTRRTLVELVGGYASHVSDWLATDGNKNRRALPAKKIKAFEAACGNLAITQWLARQAEVTILEEMLAKRRVA